MLMTGEYVKNQEGDCRDLFKVFCQHLPGKPEENPVRIYWQKNTSFPNVPFSLFCISQHTWLLCITVKRLLLTKLSTQ